MDVKWFSSKIDWWLGVILVGVPLFEVGVLASSLLRRDSTAAIAALFGCAVVAAIYGLLVVPVRCGIAEDQLIIRFGVMSRHVRLGEILEVVPSHNPVTSPALSLDRLAVRTGPGPSTTALISPDRRDEFLEALASRTGLVSDGPRLVRPSRADD